MSGGGVKFLWQDAYALAMDFKKTFIADSSCRAIIAGSIRREKKQVGDIEIVCIPQYEKHQILKSEATLFAPAVYEAMRVNLLAGSLRKAAADGRFEVVKGLKRDDPRYVQVLWKGIKVDIFMCDYENWGYQLVLRTGPGDANRWLVTPPPVGGKPKNVIFKDGCVWVDGSKVDMLTEEDFFDVVGMDFIKPSARCVAAYRMAKRTGAN